MTDITNTDDIIDVRDVIARVEELREQRTPRFVAGWNMPGYMPDSEPQEFESAEHGRAYIAEQMEVCKNEAGDFGNEGNVVATDAAIDECLNGEGEYGATFGNWHYFVTEDGVMGLDEEEAAELELLESLLSELCGYGGDEQWEGNWYPITLIRDSYFEEAMDEMVEECYDMPKNLPSFMTITLDYVALKQDYSTVEFDGVTYFYR